MVSSNSIAVSSPALSAVPSPKPIAVARPAVVNQGSALSHQGATGAAVAQVNQHLQQAQPELKLQVDAGSGRTVFQVIQQGTGQVVMQVPSEEVLGMSRRLRELEGQAGASGALVDREG